MNTNDISISFAKHKNPLSRLVFTKTPQRLETDQKEVVRWEKKGSVQKKGIHEVKKSRARW